jgi:hypothetical protein
MGTMMLLAAEEMDPSPDGRCSVVAHTCIVKQECLQKKL